MALKKGATRIRILGGLGGRLDHTLGNIGLLLRTLEQGVETHSLDSTHDIMVTVSKLSLKKKPGWSVSLIPLTLKVLGVTTTGLAYKLDKAELFIDSTRGIHNEFIEETATVEVTDGVLLVICFRD
jgi:thiamine pyrophosphokinase